MRMSHTAIFYYVKYKQKSVIYKRYISYFILTYFNTKYKIKSSFFDSSTFMHKIMCVWNKKTNNLYKSNITL